MRSLTLLSALVLDLPLGALAHMEMRWPYSFRSKYNPANTDPDYSNTSPLLADGSNFPCKNYQDLPGSQDPVVTYTPGQTYNLTLAGTATHGGGSCQISLSYDDGKTFEVIKSMIGGCPLKLDWDFTIPNYAPPSNSAILAWTWFNLIGNREMYMQCARVAITGQAVQRYRRTSSKRQTSISQLPPLFECNIGNGCTTVEMHEVVFPDPGNVIEYGTDAVTPQPGPGFVGYTGPTSSGFPGPSSTPAGTATTPPTTSAATTSTGSVTSALSTIAPVITTPPYPYPNGTSPGGFYSGTGTGYGTGYQNTTTTVTQYTNSTSSAQVTSFGGGTTGNATATVTTITQIVPIMPNGMPHAIPSVSATRKATLPTSVMPVGLPHALPTASSFPSATFETFSIPSTTSLLMFITATSSVPSTTAAPSPTSTSSSCTPGAFRCDSSTTFSQCVSTGDSSTDFISMGSVADGMQCVDGAIVRETSGTCQVNGALLCDGDNAFYECVDGGLVLLGSVNPGMVCSGGVISPPSS